MRKCAKWVSVPEPREVAIIVTEWKFHSDLYAYICVYVWGTEDQIDPWNYTHLDTHNYSFKDGEMHLIKEGIWLSVNFLNIPFAPHHLLHDNWLCLLVEVLKIGSKSFYIYSHNVIWHISALSFSCRLFYLLCYIV